MSQVHPERRLFVGTVPSKSDLALINREHWYRVPVTTVRDEPNWPPAWFAPWETGAANSGDGQQIRALWKVRDVEQASREQLFPGEERAKSPGKRYWRLTLHEPSELASPIVTTRRRQSVFIYSDLCRLPSAVTVNDLWCDSPLEDEFWRGLKARNIPAERQWPTYGQDAAPAIFDFAVFCAKEDIDIEVDGEQHHTVPDISRNDCRRDNASQLKGFRTLRFDSRRVRTDLDDCLNDVEQMIRQCGGLERAAAPADAVLNAPGRPSQLPLFAPDARPRGGDSRRTPRRTRATRPQAQLSGKQTRLL